jgi:hypothetical protein
MAGVVQIQGPPDPSLPQGNQDPDPGLPPILSFVPGIPPYQPGTPTIKFLVGNIYRYKANLTPNNVSNVIVVPTRPEMDRCTYGSFAKKIHGIAGNTLKIHNDHAHFRGDNPRVSVLQQPNTACKSPGKILFLFCGTRTNEMILWLRGSRTPSCDS